MAQPVQDGNQDFSLGQDAWKSPDLIQPNQYAKGINVSNSRGDLGPRPGFEYLPLVFENTTLTTSYGHVRRYEDLWRAGKAQAFAPYPLASGGYIITVVCGLIWKTNVKTGKTFLLSDKIKLNQYASRVNWSYAADKIILFDYPDYPVVVDGDDVFRCSPTHKIGSVTAPQIPISTTGTFNESRLFVANAGVEFTASDAVGNLATPEAPITFTEIFTPSGAFFDQFFSLPVGETIYPITAMGFLQQIDSSTGIGPLFVATQKKLYSYAVNQPRALWGEAGFGSVILANAGIVGPRAFSNVNSDLVFVADDGRIHALSTARNDAQRWGNTPASREVDVFLGKAEGLLYNFAVVSTFGDRIFITANPYRVGSLDRSQNPVTDYAHAGMVVLELSNLSSFLSQGTPMWSGLYTGLNPIDMGVVGSEFFVLSKDGCGSYGENVIYRLEEDRHIDITPHGRRPIRSIVYTREYSFQTPFIPKRGAVVNFLLRNLGGKFSLDVERRAGHGTEYLKWASWEHDAPIEFCDIPDDLIVNGISPQNLKFLIFGDPEETGCNPVTRDQYEEFTSLQLRLTFSGEDWVLQAMKLSADAVPFKELQDTQFCEKLPRIKIPAQCVPDWNIPEVSLCNQ